MIDTVTRFAPNFRASVLATPRAVAPRSRARIRPHWAAISFHGRLTLDQLFAARPVLGHANYRMPVRGLYLYGSGAHPGAGGVTGIPGHNAAREILRDARRRRGH